MEKRIEKEKDDQGWWRRMTGADRETGREQEQKAQEEEEKKERK